VRPGPPQTHEERWLLAAVANARAFTGEPHEETLVIAKRALADGQLLHEETSEGQGWFLAVGPRGWCDDFDAYEETCLEALADARRRGSIILSDFQSGRITDAIADAQQAIDAEREGWQQFAPAVRAQLAWALIERDDLSGAERALEMPHVETEWADSALRALVEEARGEIALLRGNVRGAVEGLEATGEMVTQLGASNPSIVPWRSRLALAASALGERDRALELAEEELVLARRFGARRPIGVSLRALGLVSGGEAGSSSCARRSPRSQPRPPRSSTRAPSSTSAERCGGRAIAARRASPCARGSRWPRASARSRSSAVPSRSSRRRGRVRGGGS